MVNSVGVNSANKPIPGYQMENVQGSRYNQNEHAGESSAAAMHNMKDKIMSSDMLTKTKVKIEQTTNLPDYVYRGMKGDPDFNFFEFLQISKIPYFVGGPVLAGVFLASRNNSKMASKAAGGQTAKKIALGVALYYASAALAKAVIDVPVKMMRGIDLNHPYKDVVDLREGTPLNLPANKKKEYHKVFESVDFTRWDLLYDYSEPNNDAINKNYKKIAKSYGLDGKTRDIDSTLKDKIRTTIVMANTWKYMLLAPFVTMFLGLAQQPSFNRMDLKLIGKSIGDLFRPSAPNKWIQLKNVAKHEVAGSFKNGFKELWKGTSKASGIIGKAAIISSVALPIIANLSIFMKTSSNSENLVHLNKQVKKG